MGVEHLKAVQGGKNYSYIDDNVTEAFVKVVEDYYQRVDLIKI